MDCELTKGLGEWLEDNQVVRIQAGVHAYPIIMYELTSALGEGWDEVPFGVRVERKPILEPDSVVFISTTGNIAILTVRRH